MSNQKKSSDEIVQLTTDYIISLVDSFRSSQKLKYEKIARLFYRSEYYPELAEEIRLVWQVIDLLKDSNPHISPRLIFSFLINEIVGIVLFNPYVSTTDDEFADMAKEKTLALLQYSSHRNIDIPIMGLIIDGPPFGIGETTLHPITDIDRTSEWWEKVKINYSGDPNFEVNSYGRVLSPGDSEIAIDFAETTVQETLLVLRGIGFPFFSEDVNQFGILNEYSTRTNKPLRLHKPNETIRIDGVSKIVTRLGPPINIWRLYADIINKIDESIIEYITRLMSNKNIKKSTKMQHKVLFGLRWLGEATKPDAIEARYLKLSTAFEYLIGGESNEEYLTTRGITATLAERAAFLLGESQEQRLSIDREVRRYYRLRSEIVHGGSGSVKETNFEEFGNLVREVAFALCRTLSQFDDINDFQKWILSLRYE